MISNILVDFDSTVISCEIMEVLWKVSLEWVTDKELICKQIENITNQGMNGEIWFAQSLSQRLSLLPLSQIVIKKSIDYIRPKISNSFKQNIAKLLTYNFKIISWGFKNIIDPLMLEIWIDSNKIYANELIFDNNHYVWVDTFSFLAQDKWKVKCVSSMWLNWNTIIIWDWYTDYEIKLSGYADYFCYYAENVKREKVMPYADYVLTNFDDLWKLWIL